MPGMARVGARMIRSEDLPSARLTAHRSSATCLSGSRQQSCRIRSPTAEAISYAPPRPGMPPVTRLTADLADPWSVRIPWRIEPGNNRRHDLEKRSNRSLVSCLFRFLGDGDKLVHGYCNLYLAR
jgi:hypothetical protein